MAGAGGRAGAAGRVRPARLGAAGDDRHRRGWALQATIAAGALVVCRLFTAPAENINFAFVDPIFGRAFTPAALHLAIVLGALAGVAYGATHLALLRSAARRRYAPTAATRDAASDPLLDRASAG